jgi:thioredoxin reductase (NADPH)
MFPRLEKAEIDRIRRFGEARHYAANESIFKVGEVAPGLVMIVTGKVEVTHRQTEHAAARITLHEPGSFMGELAQLAGRPALVDSYAREPVEALVIAPDRLRALLIAEAELGERIMRALILRRVGLLEDGTGGPVIIGAAGNGDVLRLDGFLRRNGHPHRQLDPDIDSEAKALIERFHVDAGELPIVLCPGGELLRNPSETQLARCIGLLKPLDPARVYDVAVIGAGPAGLATAVYASSEGLSVLMLDGRSFGGQAGASARIENYLGFPTGISGMALMARAYNQAQKFGVEIAIPTEVISLAQATATRGDLMLNLQDRQSIAARSIVIATGARYRRPALDNLYAFEATSVHYWASPLEVNLCARQEVALVGGGNSAGQAAVYLAGKASKVWLVVRGPVLTAMSQYLVDRIASIGNIEVVANTEVMALEGADGMLNAIRWRRGDTGEVTRKEIKHLFLFIGADPNTDWLAGSDVALDSKGFVKTGGDLATGRHALETSRDRIFAIGDVRSASTKRVAAAVGEGAQVVAAIHAVLAGLGETAHPPERSS